MKIKGVFLLLLLFSITKSAVLIHNALDLDTDFVLEGTHDEPMYNSTEFIYGLQGIGQPGALPRNKRPGSATNTHSCDRIRSLPSQLRSATHMHPRGLTEYYQKYTEAYGIPIVSSNQPPDDALKRACYVVRFMLADRYDVRDALYKRHGRVGVIGVREPTNGIPEHSNLDSWWNTRARGLGATEHQPICTNSEENILCHGYPGDRWNTADILVHEFAHGVHLLGAKYAINGFDSRLQQIYNARKVERNRWANTYAMTNHIEMFAEATESYFDVNAHANPANGIHNEVSTRAKLRAYDPQLYSLVQEVFPCENKIVDRCNKSRSAEMNADIRMNCAGGDKDDEDRDDDRRDEDDTCIDVHQHCNYWRTEGYCTGGEWIDYMEENCPKSCDKCKDVDPEPEPEPDPIPNCKDKSKAMCPKWKKAGKLNCSKKKYKKKCKQSCGVC